VLMRYSLSIISSPPYGDSKTTVAYGQFSRLALQWLGYSKVNIDRESLGGVLSPSLHSDLPSRSLTGVLKRIALRDAKRAREVLSFFTDLNRSLRNLAPLLRDGGHLAIVIGNRRVKGFTIPTDVIIAELCRETGLSRLKTIIRAIPTKRMPRVNSPTNAPGVTDTTMNNEYIVILRKESRHARKPSVSGGYGVVGGKKGRRRQRKNIRERAVYLIYPLCAAAHLR